MPKNDAIDKDAIIAALRDTQTGIAKADCYGADAKHTMSNMCEQLISALKKNNADFWTLYNSYLNDETDLVVEMMDYVFLKLNVDTIDPIAESLA